ncbi:MAG: aspartate 1-decarboxylase [Candidatus Margulisiibacteriota bacterium]
MLRQMMRSKIHRLTVTRARLDYEGSITVDEELLKAADIAEGEKVQIVNVNNGSRFETYVMKGKKNSGQVCLNGAAARLGAGGDIIILITYADVDEASISDFMPKVVLVDAGNKIKKVFKFGKGGV